MPGFMPRHIPDVYVFQSRVPADIPGLSVVAAGTAWQGGEHPQAWAATIYPGPKGNFVFNASTIFWAQGLSSPPGHTLPWSHWSRPHGPDPRVQRITANLLQRALEPTDRSVHDDRRPATEGKTAE